jgi:hypothetical protein
MCLIRKPLGALVVIVWILGGLGLSEVCDATNSAFTFIWTGTVERIEDGYGNPATVPGVSVGDAFMATVEYSPEEFGPGVNVIGDGLDYAAPAGLEMEYSFFSGGVFTKDITAVRARDGGTFDQWNWKGGDFGGLLFQCNDFTDSSWDLPLPVSFPEMHTLFLATISNFEASEGNSLGFPAATPEDMRRIFFENQVFSITPVSSVTSSSFAHMKSRYRE